MSVLICDFNDSFTYNIFAELPRDLKVKIVNYKALELELKNIFINKNKTLLILGPGPGHPDDYDELYPIVYKALDFKNIFIFGICLGHQIIARVLEFNVSRSKNQLHGLSVIYNLDSRTQSFLSLPQRICVQRYNSLAVRYNKLNSLINKLHLDIYTNSNEIIIFYGTNLLSYQFHPESIGTNYRELFFKRPIEFLL